MQEKLELIRSEIMVGPIPISAPKQVGKPPGSRPEFGVPRKPEALQHAVGSREWIEEILSSVRLDISGGFGVIVKHMFNDLQKTVDILLSIIADRTADCGARKKAVIFLLPLIVRQPNLKQEEAEIFERAFATLLKMTHDPALREIIHAALEHEVGFRMGIARMDRQDWNNKHPGEEYPNEHPFVLDSDSKLNWSILRSGTKLELLLAACEMHASGTCPECEGT